MKAVKRNREGVKKTARKVAAKNKAIQRGHAAPPPRKSAPRPKKAQPKPAQRERRVPQDELSDPLVPMFSPPAGQANAEAGVALPVIAICGRPNVGKSTLFNKLTESRRSIVGDEPGITRDRIYGDVNWNGRRARIVDTGGIIPDDEALIPAEIYRQARVGAR